MAPRNTATDRDRQSGPAKSRVHDNSEMRERSSLDEWVPNQKLREPLKIDGYQTRWVAESVNGFRTERVKEYLDDGYSLVTAEDLPDDFVHARLSDDGYVRQGGLILMKVPEQRAAAILRYYDKARRESMAAVNVRQGIPDEHATVDDNSRRLTGAEIAGSV